VPAAVAPLFDSAVTSFAPELASPPALSDSAPLALLSLTGGLVVLAAAVLRWLLLARFRRLPSAAAVTWDCGYAAPRSSMQYTSSSFADTLVRMFGFVLWPKTERSAVRGPFPRPAMFASEVPDAVLDRLVVPIARAVGAVFSKLHWIQRGSVHQYLGYILGAVLLLLVWR
jgi:hydrogenase-4 component B